MWLEYLDIKPAHFVDCQQSGMVPSPVPPQQRHDLQGVLAMNRSLVTSAAATLALAALATGAWAQKTELLVYTALETDQLKAYTESFQKTNPNIDLKFVRDSTGVITAKVLAEKANPQADVILGVSATSVAIFAAEGMLAPYSPVGFAA